MKKILTCALVLIGFAFTISNPTISNFIFITNNEIPRLPVTPYDYASVEFPAHLLGGVNIGYETKEVDVMSFVEIDDHKATLGRVLFYDQKLSALETMSCGSCHNQALSFSENKKVSEGLNAPTLRNSMHLNDIAWTNKERFFWDMSETNLNTMIRLPLTDENEIGANMDDIAIKLSETTYYPELFNNAFGDNIITEDRIVDALVQFLSSMTTFNSRFDQQASNRFRDFTQLERNGMALFSGNCSGCHTQGAHNRFNQSIPNAATALEASSFIFTNGLPADTNDRGAGEWNAEFDQLFKIPTLRNIELTAPYMHDGRFNTLEEVVEHYSTGVEANEHTGFFLPSSGFQFSEYGKSALVAFLKTLTDKSFTTNPKWSDPFIVQPGHMDLTISDLIIRPNPMRDVARIEFLNPDQQEVDIEVYNVSGKVLFNTSTTADYYQLDKSNFTAGSYFVNIKMGDRKATAQMIVQ